MGEGGGAGNRPLIYNHTMNNHWLSEADWKKDFAAVVAVFQAAHDDGMTLGDVINVLSDDQCRLLLGMSISVFSPRDKDMLIELQKP